jgi:hypothetical protein
MVERRLDVIAINFIRSLAWLGVALAVFFGPSLDDLRKTARSWSFVSVPLSP